MEKRFAEFFRQVEQYVLDKQVPGAVAAVGRGDEIFGIRTYGNAIITPVVEPMTENTLFDIASLSKLTSAWAPMMLLLQEGKVKLDTYLPDAVGRKVHPSLEKVQVFNLLTHTSCLVPTLNVYEMGESREERMEKLFITTELTSINEKVVYNDPDFIFLGEIVAHITGKPLEIAAGEVWKKLGMLDTCFNPAPGAYCAATEIRKGETLPVRGSVHDERSVQLRGVSGHAGVFSTARDLCRFCAALLPPKPSEIFDPEWIRKSFTNHTAHLNSNRGLGWIAYHEKPGGNIVGHTGFTGTSLWLDSETGVYTVLLTNRVHPSRSNDAPNPLRKRGFETIYGVPYLP